MSKTPAPAPTAEQVVMEAITRKCYVAQSTTERDAFLPVYRKFYGKNAPSKKALDQMVEPAVKAGLLTIRNTVVRGRMAMYPVTHYDLTEAGRRMNLEWMALSAENCASEWQHGEVLRALAGR